MIRKFQTHSTTILNTLLLFLLTVPSLLSAGEPADMTPPAPFSFSGRVVHVTLEGGFFGLVADDGSRYDPMNLPETFRNDGLRVTVKARRVPGAVSIRMWGTIIEVLEILPADH